MKKIGLTLLTIAAIAITGFYGVQWMEHIDAEREAAYLAYEKCVLAEYGVLPSTWYEETGEVPPCNTNRSE